MTAMCDIIFILIVFFIFTVKIKDWTLTEDIRLARSEDATKVVNDPPSTVTVVVGAGGEIILSRQVLGEATFEYIVRSSKARHGDFPVVIAADSRTKHIHVKKVMDICAKNGLHRLKFLVLKEGEKS